jgi:hypothetical protein
MLARAAPATAGGDAVVKMKAGAKLRTESVATGRTVSQDCSTTTRPDFF